MHSEEREEEIMRGKQHSNDAILFWKYVRLPLIIFLQAHPIFSSFMCHHEEMSEERDAKNYF